MILSITETIVGLQLLNVAKVRDFEEAQNHNELETGLAGYLLPTDDRYREHHDHIWIVLQFVE